MKRLGALAFLVHLGGLGCSSSPGRVDAGSDVTLNAPIPGSGTTHTDCGWTQLGQNASHTGQACAPAQGFNSILASVTFDPFVALEVSDAQAQSGAAGLLAHFQAPLVTGDDVYLETKSGTYTSCLPGQVCSRLQCPCGVNAWDSQVWNETYYRWQSGALLEMGHFESDWKPVPGALAQWEPLFHAALDGNVLWVPGVGGTVYRVDRHTLLSTGQVNPFGSTVDTSAFVAGPITVGPDGTVLYNVVRLAPGLSDVSGVLVRIEPDGVTVHAADYPTLMVNPPAADGGCLGSYSDDGTPRPWPPPDNHRVTVTCGSLRPGLNVAPAVAADGTVFTVAFPNNAPNAGVLLALHPDLSPKWSASLQEILDDGCGVLIPSRADTGSPYDHCRLGAPQGVDPDTGQRPSVQVLDTSTSSPVALPDGAVLYGGWNYYNSERGHLVKFDATGKLVATFDDGWDQTPAVWSGGDAGSYTIIVKDNHYFSWTGGPDGPYAITQLDANLQKQWSSISTNTESCYGRSAPGTSGNGGTSCVSDHPNGFEWCVNAAAIDENGTVYANSEDGRVYALLQGGAVAQSRFLVESLGAAYTPVTVDGEGRVYTMNGGVLTVVGK